MQTGNRPTIGSCLRLLREEQGLTQRQLADASCVSSSFVFMAENDRHHNTLRLERVASSLGISLLAAFAMPDQPSSKMEDGAAGVAASGYAADRAADERFIAAYRALPPRQRRTMQRMLESLSRKIG